MKTAQKLLSIFFVLFFSCFVVTENVSAQTTADEQASIFLESLLKGKISYQKHFETVNDLLGQDIESAQLLAGLYYVRSLVNAEVWKLQEALDDAEHSLELFPVVVLYVQLSKIYNRMGHNSDALLFIDQAISINPANSDFFPGSRRQQSCFPVLRIASQRAKPRPIRWRRPRFSGCIPWRNRRSS